MKTAKIPKIDFLPVTKNFQNFHKSLTISDEISEKWKVILWISPNNAITSGPSPITL